MVEAATRVYNWDEEATLRAMEHTRAIALRDPDASQYVASQVVAQPSLPALRAYNFPETEARMLLMSGLKPWEGDEMHFMRYFALVREVSLAKEQEKAEYDKAQGQYTSETLPPDYKF